MIVESIKNPVMTLITKAERTKLLKAGYNGRDPIVKLFMGPITWLLTGEEDGYLYGFGDIGQGCVEWGSLTNIEELPTIRHRMGFYMERDRWFSPKAGVNYTSLETLTGI